MEAASASKKSEAEAIALVCDRLTIRTHPSEGAPPTGAAPANSGAGIPQRNIKMGAGPDHRPAGRAAIFGGPLGAEPTNQESKTKLSQ